MLVISWVRWFSVLDTGRWYSGGCRDSRGGTRLAHLRPSLSLRRGDTHTRHPLSRVSMPGAAASSNSAEAGQNWVLCHHPIPCVSFLLLMLRSGCRARSLGRRCRYFSRNGWERERPLRRGRRESDRSAEAVPQESGSGCGRHSAHDPGPVELGRTSRGGFRLAVFKEARRVSRKRAERGPCWFPTPCASCMRMG